MSYVHLHPPCGDGSQGYYTGNGNVFAVHGTDAAGVSATASWDHQAAPTTNRAAGAQVQTSLLTTDPSDYDDSSWPYAADGGINGEDPGVNPVLTACRDLGVGHDGNHEASAVQKTSSRPYSGDTAGRRSCLSRHGTFAPRASRATSAGAYD